MRRTFMSLRLGSFVVLILISLLAHAQVIRVTGKVIDEKKTPITGVNITDETGKRTIAVTDNDGRYAVNVLSNGTMIFSYVGYKTQTIRVKGHTTINISMMPTSIKLNEVQVVAKRIVDKVVAEPTSIEVVGQYFHVRTRVRVPKELFHSNCRLVVQPVLHDLTSRKDVNMKPIVFDGKEYNLTQSRMYDFDISRDSLSPYITVANDSTKSREKSTRGNIIPYHDSIYVQNSKHDFACDVFMGIENYKYKVYGDTSTIAKGTVNPLRFLSYKFASFAITDSAYFPKGEMQLRDGKGDINLIFSLGSSVLDTENPTNKSELARLNTQLKEIENGKGTQLRDFTIRGLASPDGSYKGNIKLAKARMQSSLNMIVAQLNAETRKELKVGSDAKVASWDDLIKLLRKDSLKSEANEIQDILDRQRGEKATYLAIRHLPFYKNTLEGKYLPKLRKSEYSYMYTLYRHLTTEEIQELYNKDYKQLSRFEFWKLYNSKTNSDERAKICAQALQVYPNFMMAANDLAVYHINKGESNDSILEPFAGSKAPKEVNMNQVIALLDCGRFAKADTLTNYIPDMEETRLLRAITRALNGKYKENFSTIAETGKRNEVLMLLAMKQNEEALKGAEELPEDEAMTFYLRATCLNRLDRADEAYDALKQAFEMDPSLKKIAKADGDVNNLLPKDEQLTNE